MAGWATIRFWRRRFRDRGFFGCDPASIAFSIAICDCRVVDDAIDGGNSYGGIGEGMVPLAERLIPGQDQAFITFQGSVRCW